jgi:hypothetical protein
MHPSSKRQVDSGATHEEYVVPVAAMADVTIEAYGDCGWRRRLAAALVNELQKHPQSFVSGSLVGERPGVPRFRVGR